MKVRYIYDAWGNCTIDSSTADIELAKLNPIRYRGYYYDRDTGLYYLNARYYSPELRRFISPDDTAYLNPENVNGLNLYAYCYNDPVNYADPSGHSVSLILGLIGLGLGIGVGVGYAAYKDYNDDFDINGSIGWQPYVGYAMTFGALFGLSFGYLAPAIASLFGSTFTFTVPTLGGMLGAEGVLVAGATVTVTGAQILQGVGVLAGLGILYTIPMHGEPNTTIHDGGSFGEYDSNGNLSYRVDTTGKPHFVKSVGDYCLPHVHKFTWRLVNGVWRYIKEVLPYIL